MVPTKDKTAITMTFQMNDNNDRHHLYISSQNLQMFRLCNCCNNCFTTLTTLKPYLRNCGHFSYLDTYDKNYVIFFGFPCIFWRRHVVCMFFILLFLSNRQEYLFICSSSDSFWLNLLEVFLFVLDYFHFLSPFWFSEKIPPYKEHILRNFPLLRKSCQRKSPYLWNLTNRCCNQKIWIVWL